MEDALEKFMMPIATVLAVALAVLLFMYLRVAALYLAFPGHPVHCRKLLFARRV